MCWSWQMCFQSLGFHLGTGSNYSRAACTLGGEVARELDLVTSEHLNIWSGHIWAAWQLVVDEEHLLTVPVYQQLQFVKEEGRGGGGGGGGGGCDAPSSSLSTRPWRRLPSISLLAASQDHKIPIIPPDYWTQKRLALQAGLQPSSFIKYSNGKTYCVSHRAIIIFGKNRANLNFWKMTCYPFIKGRLDIWQNSI